MRRTKQLAALLLLSSLSQITFAQQKQLSDDNYFKNNLKGIVQPLPMPREWVDNEQFLLMKDGKYFLANAKTGVETATTRPTSAQGPYIKNKDVFIKVNDKEIQLTNDTIAERNPTYSPDSAYVAFTRSNDLYTVHIATKKETRLTQDGANTILNGFASWVYMEEILGRATNYKAYWWSPDSKHIAFFRSDETAVPEFIITDAPGLHGVVEKTRYPKVGDPNPEVNVGIVSPDGGKIVWSDFNPKDDQYFGKPYWKPDGSSLLVQWMNRLQDNLIVYDVNLTTGAKKAFYTETQKTWIDLDDQDRITFLKNSSNFILQSDATGWKHLYYYDNTGKLINAITSGEYTVTDVEYIDEKNKLVYFVARGKENTARRDLYKIGLNGKGLQRLTFGDYNHQISSVSPDGSYFITSYSNVQTPTQIALVNNKGKIVRSLGDSKGAEFDQYQLAKTEFLRVKSDDGLYDLPLKVTWPTNMDKQKKYPVLISIYGGPNAGTAFDTWALNGTQQFYAKEGLIQVVMDHRASGHFGKQGVNFMYHNLGYWEMKDYSTMVKWLIDNGNADPTKIAITGFSYGGYLSSYAITYGADVFTHAMAGGSVIDWTLYDSHYTERFMGTPANNPKGYETSSVLNYVDKYKGKLQLVHGIIDDNVHLQNSIQFSSKLQDLKKDFEEMFYSGGRHGWGGNKGLHFQNLKTKFIYRYLLQKDVPAGMLR